MFVGCLHVPQVKLLLAAVDQLASDAIAMSSRLKQQLGSTGATTADIMTAAGTAAASAAAQMALERGQEAGSTSAAASKAAAVLVETAGLVSPAARLQDVPATATKEPEANSSPTGQPSQHQHHQPRHQARSTPKAPAATTPSGRRQQQQEAAAAVASAQAASRAAAELHTLQVLLSLPYAEIICFADVWDAGDPDMAATSSGHR